MRRGKVVIGYVNGTEMSSHFHESVLGLVMYDINNHQRVVNGGGRIQRYSSANISNARNGVVRQFLDETQAEWLWMIDTDMTFPPDVVERIVAEAHPEKAPIVGGLCFGVDEGELFATLYDMVQETPEVPPHMVRYNTWPDDTMFQVIATGAACLLVHRRVAEAIREKYPEPYPWFQEMNFGGQPMGEDITFCLRAGLCGFPIFVHTGVHIGHAKVNILTKDMYDKQRRLAELEA